MKDHSYIEAKLKDHLNFYKVKHVFNKVTEYALFPVGKLFRPQLVYALASDLNSHSLDHEYLASAIEMHHTYTLIHDDLPAMDDDDYRRGRYSTHKKFGEANAILAGDALLGMSYGLLSKISSHKLANILELFHLKTGQQGLILGQVLDLEVSEKTFDDVILIHKLKTARLIQLSLSGSNLLCEHPLQEDKLEDFGEALGITFQLLDDLCELSEPVSIHESEINPFILFGEDIVYSKLKEDMTNIQFYIVQNNLKNTKIVIEKYYNKINSIIKTGRNMIERRVKPEKIDEILNLTSS